LVDTLTKEKRSWNMSRIGGKDTRPEIFLRSMLHRAGYRFRLHDRKLPGKPDIVFPKYHIVIFVNGCYWHRHESCPKATTPKTRTHFWKTKFRDTVARDKQKTAELVALGWRTITVWECELDKNPGNVLGNLRRQLKEGD